jgi:hypothetical protein
MLAMAASSYLLEMNVCYFCRKNAIYCQQNALDLGPTSDKLNVVHHKDKRGLGSRQVCYLHTIHRCVSQRQ